MKRWSVLLYGVVGHLLFLAVYAWFCGFVGNFGVPNSIDSPASSGGATALLIDVALLLAFGLSHSIMARPAFKQVWTRVVPTVAERSTYVFVSCFMLALLMWKWQPLTTTIWDVESGIGRAVLWMAFAAGWLLVPAVSLMINHFDLFGTRQVWLYFKGRPYQSLPFRTPALYAHVRHPLYIGWALAFWATPTMTVGHLVLAGVLTGYMVLASLVEERDLVAHFGETYEHYRRTVPRFVPSFCTAKLASTTENESADALPEASA